MAIAHVKSTAAVESSGPVASQGVTFSSGCAVGNLVCVGISHYVTYFTTDYTVGDTVNTYTQDQFQADANGSVDLHHTYATTTATLTVTVTNTAGNRYTSLGASEFSGADSGTAPSVNSNTATGTGATAGSITPATDGYLFFAVLTQEGAATSITEDKTLAFEDEGATNQDIAAQYFIQPTAAALNMGWTLGASRLYSAAVMAFKPTAGGASAKVLLPYYYRGGNG